MPQIDHHPKADKQEDPAQLKRFRAHPEVKRAKDRFRKRLKEHMPMSEAQVRYDREVAAVRKQLGFD